MNLHAHLQPSETKYGLGLPLKDRPVESLIPYTRTNYAGRPIYQMGISFFKVALLISYLRLFKGTSHVIYRRIVWITMILIVAGHLGCALTLILACQPMHKSWEPTVPGKCLAPGPSFTAYAIVTIVSDIAVTIIPIPALLKLQVSRSRKVGLIFIFLLGLFITICSVFRYREIDRIQYGDGNTTMLIVWGVIEFNVGVRFLSCGLPIPGHVSDITTTNNRTLPKTEHRLLPPLPRACLPAQGPAVHEQIRQRWRQQQVRQRRRAQHGQPAGQHGVQQAQQQQVQHSGEHFGRCVQAQQRVVEPAARDLRDRRPADGQRGEYPQVQPGEFDYEERYVQCEGGLDGQLLGIGGACFLWVTILFCTSYGSDFFLIFLL
jgi:hypothetical protein